MTPHSLGDRLGERRRLVYHVTRAASLPDIAASGALLAASARRGTPLRHPWGINNEAGRGLVCLSLAPSWGIQSNRFPGEEAAILGFDARAVGDLPGVRPCPHNSGSHDAIAYVEGQVDPHAALGEVLADKNWSRCEVLVPQAVPLGALKIIHLSDGEALARWAPQVRGDLGADLAAAVTIRADRRDGPRPHFPEDHEVTEPRASVGPGTDQRAVATPLIDPATVREVDLGAVDEELADDDEVGPDLFDVLYGEGGRDRALR